MGFSNLREKSLLTDKGLLKLSLPEKMTRVEVIIPRTFLSSWSKIKVNVKECLSKKAFKAIKYFFLKLMGKKIKWEVSLCQLTFNALPVRLIG